MKKYLFGVFAIALAVAFSAFTAPKKTSSVDPILFQYQGADESGFYTASNWEVVSSFDIVCSQEIPVVACRLQVSITDIDTKEELASYLSTNTINTEVKLESEAGIQVVSKKDEE